MLDPGFPFRAGPEDYADSLEANIANSPLFQSTPVVMAESASGSFDSFKLLLIDALKWVKVESAARL